MNIGIFYFSGTGVTETYAKLMAEEVVSKKHKAQLINITPFTSRQQEAAFDSYDALLFGFPVYSDFAPDVINDWIPQLKGNRKKCGLFFTYGGRSSGYCHYHSQLLFEKAGFQVLSSVEYLGPHTFNVAGWKACTDRPNKQDAQTAKAYINQFLEKLSRDKTESLSQEKPGGYDDAIKLYTERQPSKARTPKNPVRKSDACTMCRKCEQECPSNAFDAESGLSDPEKCMGCMHCVVVCPEHAIGIGKEIGEMYPNFLKKYQLTEEIMDSKKSMIVE